MSVRICAANVYARWLHEFEARKCLKNVFRRAACLRPLLPDFAQIGYSSRPKRDRSPKNRFQPGLFWSEKKEARRRHSGLESRLDLASLLCSADDMGQLQRCEVTIFNQYYQPNVDQPKCE